MSYEGGKKIFLKKLLSRTFIVRFFFFFKVHEFRLHIKIRTRPIFLPERFLRKTWAYRVRLDTLCQESRKKKHNI